MPKGQKPYASPSKKLEANADLISRRRAVDAMPEGRAKMKQQTQLNVDESTRARTFKADGGAMRAPRGMRPGPMPAMPRAKPSVPTAVKRTAMMSNGGKAKKGC